MSKSMAYIGHILVPVADLEASLGFYTRTLGLEAGFVVKKGEKVDGVGATESSAKLSSADKKMTVVLIQRPETLPARGGVIAGFVVDDLDATVKTFQKAGGKVMGEIIEMDDRKVVHFNDPNGHLFQFVEVLK